MSGGLREMSDPEWRAFVGHGTRTGKLATVRADGRPHVVPVSFVVHGSEVLFFTGPDTVKGRALRHEPRFALCVDDERPPFAFVLLEGEAQVDRTGEQVRTWAARIATRYLGAEHADAIARRTEELGEVLVRGRITKVVARTGSPPGSSPGAPLDSSTGSSAGSPTGSPPGASPGSSPGALPGSLPAARPGSSTGAPPSTPPGSLPGASPVSSPGAPPGSLPDASPGSSPDASPGSLPGVPLGSSTGASSGSPSNGRAHRGARADAAASDRIEREIAVAAPVEQVWRALTEPEHVGRWFGSGAPAWIDLRPGGVVHLDHGEHGRFAARVEAVDRPHRFAYRRPGARPGEVATGRNATLVEFTVTPLADGSLVRLVESGFDGLDAPVDDQGRTPRESHAAGWVDALEGLRRHVEGFVHRPADRADRPVTAADQPV